MLENLHCPALVYLQSFWTVEDIHCLTRGAKARRAPTLQDFFMTYFPPSLLGRPHYSFSCCFRIRPICKLYITRVAFCCLYAKVYIRIVYGHARCFALISSLRSVWNSNHFQPAATAKVGRLLIARIPPQCNDPAKCTKIFYQTCN